MARPSSGLRSVPEGGGLPRRGLYVIYAPPPSHLSATEVTRPRLEAAPAQHGTVLAIGATDPSTRKAAGVLLEPARNAAAHLLCESVIDTGLLMVRTAAPVLEVCSR